MVVFIFMSSPSLQGKVMYLRCQLNDALQVYTEAAALSRDQREIEHISLYEKGKSHTHQLIIILFHMARGKFGTADPRYSKLGRADPGYSKFGIAEPRYSK